MSDVYVKIIWIFLASVMIFFMQAGFAMLETGLTRAKNSANILTKNIMDFVIGILVFYFVGFALMFGSDFGGILGTTGFFNPTSIDVTIAGDVPVHMIILFEAMFCATAATIVSGAMAGRTKFSAYLICSGLMSGLIFPITGHWIWGGGWLSNMGFHDLAGSCGVHMVGGLCALVGAWLVGPRYGKYDKLGNSKAILGHSLPLAGLGTFILWFGWFGFNCGSLLEPSDTVGIVAVNTGLTAAASACAVMIITWIVYGKPDVSMIFNGVIVGLVSITAGADVVSGNEAVCIGVAAGIIMTFSIEFVDKKMGIDDPVGAISVHGIGGLWGVLATGIFGTGCELSVQIVGAVAIIVYVGIGAFILFGLVKKFHGMHVSQKAEIEGLDNHEHNADAYANFRYHSDR